MEGVVETLLNPSILLGLFVGVLVSLLCYYVLSSKTEKVVKKQPKRKVEVKVAKLAPQQNKQKQKPTTNKKVCHPSYASSFKGHTGNVKDADLSSNGKYLATCSEDDPGSTSTEDGSSTCSSECTKKVTISNQTQIKRSSRRQTRNKRKMMHRANHEQKSQMTPNHTNHLLKEPIAVPSLIELTEDQLYSFLLDYTLMPDQFFTNGYPDLSPSNQVCILKQCYRKVIQRKDSSSDSDQNSVSSDSWEYDEWRKSYSRSPPIVRNGHAELRTCTRCNKGFFTTDREYLTKERCNYHWGKLVHYEYTCCKKNPFSVGCTSSKLHVWNGTVIGINEPLEGFVTTKPSRQPTRKVFALDCEMCYTVKGLELCKVTILGYNGVVVYDHFVQPENEVVDYNTRYSGVTCWEVYGDNSKTFSQVQRDILNIVSADAILIGHSLDNDLRVLKLLHWKVVDTALIFPHYRGYPFRYSLKHLTSMHLQKQIQTSDIGHSPYEDALSCLELIKFKIQSHHGQKYFNLIKKNLCS